MGGKRLRGRFREDSDPNFSLRLFCVLMFIGDNVNYLLKSIREGDVLL